MQTESAGASNRGREREGERKRCGGELDCSDYSYTMARYAFSSAAIIPFSSTAGHRGRTCNVWNYLMDQLFSFCLRIMMLC